MSDENAYGKKRKASPGFTGAVKDAVKAVAEYAGKNSITERPKRIQREVDSYERMRNAQTTDSNN